MMSVTAIARGGGGGRCCLIVREDDEGEKILNAEKIGVEDLG